MGQTKHVVPSEGGVVVCLRCGCVSELWLRTCAGRTCFVNHVSCEYVLDVYQMNVCVSCVGAVRDSYI